MKGPLAPKKNIYFQYNLCYLGMDMNLLHLQYFYVVAQESGFYEQRLSVERPGSQRAQAMLQRTVLSAADNASKFIS